MPWPHHLRALEHRDFRIYATGQFVSVLGTWMQSVAQSWLMYRLTSSEFLLGLTFFCTHVPVLLFSPLGGWAADRFPRRRIVVITQTLAALQALTMAVLTYTGTVTVTHILVMAVVLGTVHAFDIPGRQTLFIQLVGKSDLLSAIALNSAAFNSARVIGPAIAGLAVAAWGEAVCFLINAISFTAMIRGLLTISNKPPRSDGPPTPGSILEGFRYVLRNPEIRTVLTMSATLNLCYGPILALGPFFADGIFHRGSSGFGFLIGAMGFGAVIGVLQLARHKGIAELPSLMGWGSATMVVALLVFAMSPSYWLSMAVMPFIGYSVMRQNAGGNSLIQTVVPESYRGRTMAIYSMTVTGILPFGSLAAGSLANWYGPRWVIAGAALLCLVGALRYRALFPAFQRWVKQQEEQKEETCVA
jgi:MFS family permease